MRTKVSRILLSLLIAIIPVALAYFFYYAPQLEAMKDQLDVQKRELQVLESQVKLQEIELESERISNELWVLRNARDMALPHVGEHNKDIFQEAVEHARKARDYWKMREFDQAWVEIDEARGLFSIIIPIIEKPTFEQPTGL